jgi:hypothetical protein
MCIPKIALHIRTVHPTPVKQPGEKHAGSGKRGCRGGPIDTKG